MSKCSGEKRTFENTDISPTASDSKTHKSEGSCNTTMESLIQSLQSTISTLSMEVSSLKNSNNDLKKTVDDLNASVGSLKSDLKIANESLVESASSTTKLNLKLDALEKENQQLKRWVGEIQDKIADIEYHQRRNNLVFEGIPEPNHRESGFEIYNLIISYLSNIIDTSDVRIARCHRMGPYKAGVNRNIIVNFMWFGDITSILENKSKLPKGVYVKPDLPKIWDDRMRMLRPVYKALRDDTKVTENVSLSKGKLRVGKAEYSADSMSQLAERYPNLSPCEKENETTIAYLGPYSPYSNMNLSSFVIDNRTYRSAEHYIQSQKASLFGDDKRESRILNADTPFEAKALSKNIMNFNAYDWEQHAEKIATAAVTAKFSQNQAYMERLLSTNKIIVESSSDTFWGTGIHLKSSAALNESSWNGRGLMSMVFNNVRENLKQMLKNG